MNIEELNAKIAKAGQEYEIARNKAISEFCAANNPYKIGDVFADHIGKIVIESIKYGWPAYNSTPCCIFYGPELKKDGTPKKNGTKRSAYQYNEKKENSDK